MARMTYWAVLERGEDGGFGVFFPDLDGCITLGDTAAEAAENAREALSLHLEAMEDAGLQEVFLPLLKAQRDGRLWRTVPGRRWYSDQRGETPGSDEVVLIHRKADR